MSNRGNWGQSSRSLINDFQLQSYAGDAVPLSSHAHSHVSEVEFSEIDLDADPTPAQQTKVLVYAVVKQVHPAYKQLSHSFLAGPASLGFIGFTTKARQQPADFHVCSGQTSHH